MRGSVRSAYSLVDVRHQLLILSWYSMADANIFSFCYNYTLFSSLL